MRSVQFYQFILDTGRIDGISNRHFIMDCFDHSGLSSATFVQYLFDLFPNRINLIPPNILVSLFIVPRWCRPVELDVLQLFWDHCPQLKNPNFLNSKIRMPILNHTKLVYLSAKCLDDGGYTGDLSSRGLEEKYKFPFQKDDTYIIDSLMSKSPLPLLQSFIMNGNINLGPLYQSINPESDTQDGLLLLDDIPGSIKQRFCAPLYSSCLVLSSESVLWYLNWWKNDVLGNTMSLLEFKTFIFTLLDKLNSKSPNTAACVDYLGADFFTTLSPDKIFSFLDDVLKLSSKYIRTFPLINALLSIPHIANNIKPHCVHFTRFSLRQNRMWDSAELFLKLGGLTMEQIWSGDDNCKSTDKGVFALKTTIPLEWCASNVGNFAEWLSYQSGTQKQLIDLIRFPPIQLNPFDQFFIFMSFSYDCQLKKQDFGPEEEEQYLKTFPPSRQKKSLSWLQTFIVYTPVEYMNFKFTTKLWQSNTPTTAPKINFLNLVGNDTQISLSHFTILIEEITTKSGRDDFGPSVLLKDIIQGVIASLFMNYQPENDDLDN